MKMDKLEGPLRVMMDMLSCYVLACKQRHGSALLTKQPHTSEDWYATDWYVTMEPSSSESAS